MDGEERKNSSSSDTEDDIGCQPMKKMQVIDSDSDTSDDNEDVIEGSGDDEAGESDSGTGDDSGSEEDDENDEDPESNDSSFESADDDESEEEEVITPNGAPSTQRIADEESGIVSDSSDGQSEKCAICLLSFGSQTIGSPENCDHSYCLECIQEWSKNVNTCPIDRQPFTLILVRKKLNGKVTHTVPVETKKAVEVVNEDDLTYCEVCGRCDREERLLLCDGCDLGYHLECLDPPLISVPIEEWFCTDCTPTNGEHEDMPTLRLTRLLPRTRQSERVRRQIGQNRTRRQQEVNDEDIEAAQTTSVGPARTPVRRKRRKLTKKRTKKGKTKRKSPKKRKTAKKLTGKTRKVKRRTRKRKVLRRKKKRVCKMPKTVAPKTVKGRLAEQLGIRVPKPWQLLPQIKQKTSSAATGSLGGNSHMNGFRAMHSNGSLQIFPRRNDLDYVPSDGEEEGNVLVGVRPHVAACSTQQMVRRKQLSAEALNSHAPIARTRTIPVPVFETGAFDVLGSILSGQSVLQRQDVTIKADGSLIIQGKNDKDTKNSKTKPVLQCLPVNSPNSNGSAALNASSNSPSEDPSGDTSGDLPSGSYSTTAPLEPPPAFIPPYPPPPVLGPFPFPPPPFLGSSDPQGSRAYANYLNSKPPENVKKDEKTKKETAKDETDEVDIYSDIEQDSLPDSFDGETPNLRETTEIPLPIAEEKDDGDKESDGELVIDDSGELDEPENDSLRYDPAEPSASPETVDTHSSANEGEESLALDEEFTNTLAQLTPSSDAAPFPLPRFPTSHGHLAVRHAAAQLNMRRTFVPFSVQRVSKVTDDQKERSRILLTVGGKAGWAKRTAKEKERQLRDTQETVIKDTSFIAPEVTEAVAEVEADQQIPTGTPETSETESPEKQIPAPTESPPAPDISKMSHKASLIRDIFGSDDEKGETVHFPPNEDGVEPITSPSIADPDDMPPCGLEGLETEAISEGEEATFGEMEDERRREPVLEGRRVIEVSPERIPVVLGTIDYEEGEIVEEGRRVKKDVRKKKSSSDKAPSQIEPPAVNTEEGHAAATISWKKPKHSKQRNYREKHKEEDHSTERKKESKKESKHSKSREKDRKREKRKELERYDVRKIVGERSKKEAQRKRRDEFGRDVSRDRTLSRERRQRKAREEKRSRSWSRSRSRSGRRTPRKRRRSRSHGSAGPPPIRSLSRSPIRSRTRSPPKRIRRRYSRSGASQSRSPTPQRHKQLSSVRRKTESPKLISRKKSVPVVSASKKKSDKREKKRDKEVSIPVTVKEKERKKKKKKRARSPPPSKEVYATGDNIVVSVNFGKSLVKETKKRKGDIPEPVIKKMKHSKSPKRAPPQQIVRRPVPMIPAHRPVVIDLEMSPFREFIPSPLPVITVDDSDDDVNDNEQEGINASSWTSPSPRSPPEIVKFVIPSKPQVRLVPNVLATEEEQEDQDEDGELCSVSSVDKTQHHSPKGPSTPPEEPPEEPEAADEKSLGSPMIPTPKSTPTVSPRPETPPLSPPPPESPSEPQSASQPLSPCVCPRTPPSPDRSSSTILQTRDESVSSDIDTYDPFNPTKSPSPPPERFEPPHSPSTPPSPSRLVVSTDQSPAVISQEPTRTTTNEEEETRRHRTVLTSPREQHVQPRINEPNELRVGESNVKMGIVLPQVKTMPTLMATQPPATVFPSMQRPPVITGMLASMLCTSLLRTPAPTPVSVQHHLPTLTSTPKNAQKPMCAKISQNGAASNMGNVASADSPYSPASSEASDLFEPPSASPAPSPVKQMSGTSAAFVIPKAKQPVFKSPSKPKDKFDSLFGSPTKKPGKLLQKPVMPRKNDSAAQNKLMNSRMSRNRQYGAKGKKEITVKVDEDKLIVEDVPSSAVEMQVKEKYLKKLNRQERVVEEVKLVLKPHYNKKHISKEEYKDVMRRAVPKICHNRSGEINPTKIRNLVEAYVKRIVRHKKKGKPQ